MNFFEHQAQAKRQTTLLVFLFLLAMTLIIIAVHFGVAGVITAIASSQGSLKGRPENFFLDLRLMGGITAIVVLIVLLGSLFKMALLSKGGHVIAEMLGGRRLDTGTRDPEELKVLNVVEEMAIASGVPVPPVYVMDHEQSINAFAAGFRPTDAVIGVSAGTIHFLDRDELQGVIAHEFSHILNGDMRLNIRLMGFIHGILLLGLLGSGILRGFGRGRIRLSSGRGGKGSGGAMLVILGIIVTAIILMVIGYIGVFFGRLIKAAVSRQREFLADASAVQFTRNPAGISGALQKIGGISMGSRLGSPSAEQASHLFFGDGIGLSGALATHPSLDERIRRVDPMWDGKYEPVLDTSELVMPSVSTKKHPKPAFPGGLDKILPLPNPKNPISIMPMAAIARIGSMSPDHLDYARQIRESIPEELREAARDPFSARAVVYSLALNIEPEHRESQMRHLSSRADSPVYGEMERITALVDSLDEQSRLPLLDLTMPALQNMSESQFLQFGDNLQTLIEADQRVTPFEFMIQHVFLRQLGVRFSGPDRVRVRWFSLNGLRSECAVLFSALAHMGQDNPDEAAKAYAVGIALLTLLKRPDGPLPKGQCGLDAMANALSRLRQTGPMQKQNLMQACVATVATDGQITLCEASLLRAVASFLDLPMPPFMPGEKLE